MPSVFPNGHEGESIHFDLDGSSDAPIRIYRNMGSDDAHWDAVSVRDVLREFPENAAKDLLLEAIRFGQGEFHRDGDAIVLASTSIPGLELVYEVVDRDYRDAGPNEEGDENGEVLAKEHLATSGLLRYEGMNKFLTDAHRAMFTRALGKRTDSKGLFPK